MRIHPAYRPVVTENIRNVWRNLDRAAARRNDAADTLDFVKLTGGHGRAEMVEPDLRCHRSNIREAREARQYAQRCGFRLPG